MDNNESEYIDLITQRIDDDAPRLQYADFLTSRNDPRGEFIRLQCDIAKHGRYGDKYWALKQHELDLLAYHGPDWRAPVRAVLPPRIPGQQISFQRGFVESLSIDTDYFEDVGPELLEGIPTLRHLVVNMFDRTSSKTSVWEEDGLGDPPPTHTTDDLRQCKQFGQIDRLRIKSDSSSGEPPTSEQLAALLNSPWLQTLRSLEFFRLSFDRRFSGILSRIPPLEHLRELAFHDLAGGCIPTVHKSGLPNTLESFTASGVWNRKSMKKLFGKGGTFPRLKRLNFDCAELDDRVATAWSKNRNISALESLRLTGSFSKDGVSAILQAPWTRELKTLSLSSGQMLGKGIIEVVGCDVKESLEELEVSDAIIGNSGVQALSRSAFPRLQKINLSSESHFGREHAQALVEAPWWSQLKSFTLCHCFIDAAAAQILGTNWPVQLESLELTCCNLSRLQVFEMFPVNRPMRSLRELTISACEIGESELVHLSRCDSFPHLLSLDLSWNPLSETGICELAESSLAKSIRILDLRDVEEIGMGGSQAMVKSSQFQHLCEVRLDGCDMNIDYDRLHERFGDRLV